MRLSPKKDLAAKLIAQGYTQAEVARDERIGVTKQTMNNWHSDEGFQERVNDYRTDPIKQVQEIFSRSVGEAAEAIVETAIGRPTVDTVNADGESITVPVDHRLISSKLKAALFIVEQVTGKKAIPTSTVKPKEELDEVSFVSDDEMDEALEYAT
jgi:hypothetical protein